MSTKGILRSGLLILLVIVHIGFSQTNTGAFTLQEDLVLPKPYVLLIGGDISLFRLGVDLKIGFRPINLISIETRTGLGMSFVSNPSTSKDEAIVFPRIILTIDLHTSKSQDLFDFNFGPAYCYSSISGHGIGGKVGVISRIFNVRFFTELVITYNFDATTVANSYLSGYFKNPNYQVNNSVFDRLNTIGNYCIFGVAGTF